MSQRDALRFVEFLDQFAKALHQVGKTLGVDAASWNRSKSFFFLYCELIIDDGYYSLELHFARTEFC